MAFYQSVLGGVVQTMLIYGESPMAASTDPRWHDRILHATLLLGDIELTGVDMLPDDYEHPQGFFVTLTLDAEARAREVFDGLSAGGLIRMPFQKTFWSPGFGVLVDKFEIPWEISTRVEVR